MAGRPCVKSYVTGPILWMRFSSRRDARCGTGLTQVRPAGGTSGAGWSVLQYLLLQQRHRGEDLER
eukprot:16325047-Heterocapsa_arctica.AAC.1